MADIKVTGLGAITPPLDNGSLFLVSSYDGVSAYTSEKITLTQLRDEVYSMEAEDKISFDSSGTNKTFLEDTNSNAQIDVNVAVDNDTYITSDSGAALEGQMYVGSSLALLGYGSAQQYVEATSTDVNIFAGGSKVFGSNSTGIGFFNSAPVAKQTSVAVSAAGIHAALVNYGLIS